MSFIAEQLASQSDEPDETSGRAEVASGGFDDAFGAEIRTIFGVADAPEAEAVPAGDDTTKADVAVAAIAGGAVAATVVSDEIDADAADDVPEEIDADAADEPGLFGPSESDGAGEAEEGADTEPAPSLFKRAPVISVPTEEKVDAAPSVGLFLPRAEQEVERPAPALTGLAIPAAETAPAAVPNLFVSSDVAPAEVAFVPAEEVERNRYRWLLILFGILLLGLAVWLTWLAQSDDTVDAPVTTVATTVAPTTAPTTTAAPTTAAPTTAAASTTAAPTTAASSTETSIVDTEPPATAPPATTPPRPATTARPTPTAAPTTAAPTTQATVPDVTFAPPTWSPDTTAAPTTAAPTTAAPTTAAAPADPPASDG